MAKPITKQKSAEAGLVMLDVVGGRNTRHLRLPVTLIGRGPNCELFLNSPSVSLAHAAITTDGQQFILSDLGSRTGVRINNQLILEIALENHMEIQIGKYKLLYETICGNEPIPWGEQRYDEPAEGVLTDSMSDQEFELVRAITCIGSRKQADVRIDDPSVSRAHALLIRTRGGVILKDLGSRNGTLVNDERVEMCMLETGDEIAVGPFSYYYQERAPATGIPASHGPQPRTTPVDSATTPLPGSVTRVEEPTDTSMDGGELQARRPVAVKVEASADGSLSGVFEVDDAQAGKST